MHKEAKEFCQAFHVCQRAGRPSRRDEIPFKEDKGKELVQKGKKTMPL